MREMDMVTTFNKYLLRPILVSGYMVGTRAGKSIPMWKLISTTNSSSIYSLANPPLSLSGKLV